MRSRATERLANYVSRERVEREIASSIALAVAIAVNGFLLVSAVSATPLPGRHVRLGRRKRRELAAEGARATHP